jgi:hypothetical protein
MSQEFAPTAKPTIEDVRRQFEAWRKTSKLHEPIPTELWIAAASLCATNPPYKIARKLRLNYTKLKDHVYALKTDLPIKKAPAAAFIELDLGVPAMAYQCVIEMQDPKGGKMTVQLQGDQCPDPIDICKAFWRRDT